MAASKRVGYAVAKAVLVARYADGAYHLYITHPTAALTRMPPMRRPDGSVRFFIATAGERRRRCGGGLLSSSGRRRCVNLCSSSVHHGASWLAPPPLDHHYFFPTVFAGFASWDPLSLSFNNRGDVTPLNPVPPGTYRSAGSAFSLYPQLVRVDPKALNNPKPHAGAADPSRNPAHSSNKPVGCSFATQARARPEVIGDPAAWVPPPPPTLAGPTYSAAWAFTRDIGSKGSTLRTADQTALVYFWRLGGAPRTTE